MGVKKRSADMPPSKKIGPTAAVIGATGFIGPHLVRALIDQGFIVRVYSRHQYQSRFNDEVRSENWYQGNLGDRDALRNALNGVEIVFQLADNFKGGSGEVRGALKSGLAQLENVYLSCIEAGVDSLVYFSSIRANKKSSSPYAQYKIAAENLLRSLCSGVSPLNLFVIRPPVVYGPHLRGNLARFIRYARLGILPRLPTLNNEMSLVSVTGLCRASIEVSLKEQHEEKVVSYIITDGEIYTPNRIEEAVYKSLDKNLPLIKTPKIAIYFVFLAARLASFIGINRGQFGLNLYRNLLSSESDLMESGSLIYEVADGVTLESELPKIISSHGQDQS